MRVAILGYGVLGQQFEAALRELHRISEEDLLLFDDHLHGAGDRRARPFSDYASNVYADAEFYVALGYKHLEAKRKIVGELLALGRKLPAYVHPSCLIHPSVRIGAGAFLYAGCNIDRNVVIGDGVLMFNGSIVAHDSVIGAACYFGPGVTISGKVVLEDCVFVGSGTAVANDVRIGERAIVGLATAVTKNVGAGASVIGNPMRVLAKPLVLV